MLSKERLDHYFSMIDDFNDLEPTGKVAKVVGLTIESNGPAANIGDLCVITAQDGSRVYAEAVGFHDRSIVLMPLSDMTGVGPGCYVSSLGHPLRVGVGPKLLGRVLDAFGNPIDGKGPIEVEQYRPLHNSSVQPLHRQMIRKPISVGVRAIDGLLTCGKGQRVGIFSGSGVGKSTLLGMMARNTSAEVNVIGLIGERGREVREFIESDLGPEGLKRSVVVVATSDQLAMIRLKGALTATTIAEYFRDCGKDVLFLMDSVTRFAFAQREVGLASGEPPATRGYPPSVFALLPKLMERTGPGQNGTITAFYTVLVDGDDFNEPIADTVRSILDGHIVLSRRLSNAQHYPAIDVLASVSRVMPDVVDEDHNQLAVRFKTRLATYREAEDLINIGAYVSGANPQIDDAIQYIDAINDYLRQPADQGSSWSEALELLERAMGSQKGEE
ncbi:MAG: flagellar protein export ATPase FliI [Firmicutes bacterium]|jgi:flagellum-specific ATP synthase|nr:flagellar protein export ATPase FliI [Bacillota bacterium]NLL88091.1 flagellar protein export ATPase FliI [Bacillota bacterium]